MQTQLVKRQRTNSGQIAVQPGMVSVPVSVHSGVPTSIPNSMTLNMPVQKEVVSTQSLGSAQAAIMPNVQILNMRPGAPAVAAQKAVVTTVPPRVMIGTQQVVGARPAAPVITLQTLQSLQQGQQSHVLIKTDNGQYQLFRVGPAPPANNLTVPQPQTLRLATVPGHSGVAAVSPSAAAPGQTSGQITSAPVASAAVAASESLQPVAQLPQPPIVTTQKPSDNTKEKCRNFLANLLDLSSKELKSVERNVRNLIQELIDAQVEPEEFCNRLERLLNASPQPCLIGFLKKSLPLLRQSLITKEMVIEGINPPAPRLAFSAVPSLTQPVLSTVNRHVTKLVPRPGGTAAAPQNAPASAKANTAKFVKATTVNSKASFPRAPGPSGAVPNVVLSGKPLLEDKEKRKQFTSQQYVDDKMAGDDDINDVAAMGGVNLAEETQKILGCSEMIGTQIRSCKDEYLVPLNIMQARIKKVCNKHGLDEPSHEVAALLSHALHERLKNLVEKLAVMGQHHRVDLFLKCSSRASISLDRSKNHSKPATAAEASPWRNRSTLLNVEHYLFVMICFIYANIMHIIKFIKISFTEFNVFIYFIIPLNPHPSSPNWGCFRRGRGSLSVPVTPYCDQVDIEEVSVGARPT